MASCLAKIYCVNDQFLRVVSNGRLVLLPVMARLIFGMRAKLLLIHGLTGIWQRIWGPPINNDMGKNLLFIGRAMGYVRYVL